MVALARQESARLGRPIGVIPEIKHPAYFRRLGLPLEELLAERLTALGVRRGEAMVQSFEPTSLRRLAVMTDVPLVQLVDSEGTPNDFLRFGDDRTFTDLTAPAGLREISTYAEVLAPHKDLVIPRRSDGSLGEPTRLVDQAHRAGLKVQVWTFRAERRFLPTGMDLAARAEGLCRHRHRRRLRRPPRHRRSHHDPPGHAEGLAQLGPKHLQHPLGSR